MSGARVEVSFVLSPFRGVCVTKDGVWIVEWTY